MYTLLCIYLLEHTHPSQLTPEQAAAVVQGSMAVSTNFFEETPISQAPSATDLLIIKDDFTAIAKLGTVLPAL